jgi:hypothetical protein
MLSNKWNSLPHEYKYVRFFRDGLGELQIGIRIPGWDHLKPMITYPLLFDHISNTLHGGVHIIPREIVQDSKGSDTTASAMSDVWGPPVIDNSQHRLLSSGKLGVTVCGWGIDNDNIRANLEFTLTPDWHTLSLAVWVQNSDVHVGGQVPSSKMRDKVCVPVGYSCYLGIPFPNLRWPREIRSSGRCRRTMGILSYSTEYRWNGRQNEVPEVA